MMVVDYASLWLEFYDLPIRLRGGGGDSLEESTLTDTCRMAHALARCHDADQYEQGVTSSLAAPWRETLPPLSR